MKASCFALVDCNNFYASCEKLFRPDLAHRPVVVLSNNDGCVVARSKEAKALGIKMGVPLFQINELIKQHRIVTFSSNYALYADLSARVMTTLELMAPAVEVYSIDEAFLDLSLLPHTELTQYGQIIRQRIAQWQGISVCVGIAPSKTLAKLANHAAKTWPKTQGVVDLTAVTRQRKLLALLPVGEVWGIGRQLSIRLQALGIHTALQLADANPSFIRQQFSVVVERTVRELNGESCIPLEEQPPTKKEIVSSRSFGERITAQPLLQEAIAEYVARACQKLRKERQHARQLTVFLRTSPFSKPQEPYYANSANATLGAPSADTRDFLPLANRLLQQIWRDGYRYAKAGVMLSDFYDEGVYQPSLFEPTASYHADPSLMQTLDRYNQSGKGKIWFASQGVKQSWAMKRQHLSPAYTTNWLQLPVVS
ncbi:translesion error-prone DNA polymerase V subunit UmuC [Rheinheimera sp. UJ51]|uniref:translesion error-prone DNA polymerase V subunit UmuC n=1 Tax=Rheinheimera sp. UJ51 TaxID=2892446 RepID=UPI001E594D08|nr:translesion error-prone DNA polymerase V subunit UmuC [Rheinheimera sp. UJ51]MCC5451843.1 translesion error-prone DNA polymerase V subunit UmuC [Rheinheimera sp. UJ51]